MTGILVDKGTDVSRGDIVVVDNPDASTDGVTSIVKRVIGLPGETVTIDDDHVIIDGHVLIEPYLDRGHADARCRAVRRACRATRA